MQGFRLSRFAFAAGLALASLGLSACGGDGLPATPQLSSDTSTDKSASGSAFPSTGIVKQTGVPQPFENRTEPLSAERQVIDKPTLQDVLAVGALPDMIFGSPNAPVTMVEYASLTCPHCRKFHRDVFPELKRTYIDTGKVRFILREFPIGKTSGTATIALRCAKPDKYLELFGKFLDQQTSWVSQEVRRDPIFAVAQQVGMKRAEFDGCLENQAMIDGLKWVKDRGRTLGIIGTPNFFIDNERIKRVLSMADIRALVEPRLNGAAAATAAAVPNQAVAN